MKVSILKNPKEVSRHIKTIASEADKYRKELGFFAGSVYLDFCNKGNLWVLDVDGEYAGHLMFSVAWSKNKITVNQAFVLDKHRGKGYAKTLIEELKSWGEKHNIIHIRANVADDLVGANSFYNSMGFKAIIQKDGGSTTGRKINVRSLNLNTPSLLQFVEEQDKPLFSTLTTVNTEYKYVLDLNVINDFLKHREHKEFVDVIIKHAFLGNLKVFVSPEAGNEILRSSPKSSEPDHLLDLVKQLPVLPAMTEKEINKLFPEIEKIVFNDIDRASKSAANKISDVMHLVYSIFNGCTGFVSRDGKILKAAEALYKDYKLEVISPEEFLLNEDEAPSYDDGITLNSEDTIFEIDNISEKDSKKLKTILDKFGVEESVIKLKQYQGISIKVGSEYYALSLWSKPHKKHAHVLAYVLYADNFNNTEVFDHILESVFRSIRKEDANCLTLYTKNDDEVVANILNKRGFSSFSEKNLAVHTRFISNNIISSNEWKTFCDDFKKFTNKEINNKLPQYKSLCVNGITTGNKSAYSNFFNFETLISPALIVPNGRKAVIVPIKPEYAEELIGNDNKLQPSFLKFDKKPAFLKMEKAYFKTPNSGCKIDKGDLVMFYASHPESAIIGVARITFSDSVLIDEVASKFKLQGVLESSKLEEISKKGKIHTITFDNFFPFCKNVSIKELRKFGLGGSCFVSTTETTSDIFLSICNLGGIYEK